MNTAPSTAAPQSASSTPPSPGDPTPAGDRDSQSSREQRAVGTLATKPSAERPAAKQSPAVTLTISEAARACDVNRRTIRHHRQAGDFPGAFIDQDGMWRIPVEDLEWVGLHPDLGRVSEEPLAGGKVDLLRTEVAVLRERLRAAELIAMEREKRIDDLRLILRMLPSPSLSASSATRSAGRLGPGGSTTPVGLPSAKPSSETTDTPAEVKETDSVIWLPDAPEGRAVPVANTARSSEADRGSIWTPVGSSPPRADTSEPSEREALPDRGPQFFGPPVEVRGRRRRWLPWRRSRG
jgi:hypothetical protein